MAGKPKRQAMIAALQARTRVHFEEADGEPGEHNALDLVCALLEGGATMRELADELSVEIGSHVWPGTLASYVCELDSESETRLMNARTRGTHAIAEDARAIVDAPAADNVDVSRAASRARVRQWTAERWNRQQYGTQHEVGVTISIGSLHLDALRAAPPMQVSARTIETVDAQLLEEGSSAT